MDSILAKVKKLGSKQWKGDTSVLLKEIEKVHVLFPQIDQVLHTAHALIAGSFPLQLILKERWTDSDVDIWTADPKGIKHLVRYFLNLDYELPTSIGKESMSEDYLRFGTTIDKIYFMHHKRYGQYPPIQLILIHVNDFATPQEKDLLPLVFEVIDSFDIDACKVIFNGKAFFTMFDNTYLPLKETSIGLKAIATQSPYEWLRTLKRIQKYQDREFTFDWNTLITLKNAEVQMTTVLNNSSEWPVHLKEKGGTPSYGPLVNVAFRNHWNHIAGVEGDLPRLFHDYTTNVTYLMAGGKVYYTSSPNLRAPANFLSEGMAYPRKCMLLSEVGKEEKDTFDHLTKGNNLIISYGNSVYCYSLEQMLGYIGEFGDRLYTKFLNVFPDFGVNGIKTIEELGAEVNRILRLHREKEISEAGVDLLKENLAALVNPLYDDAKMGLELLEFRYKRIEGKLTNLSPSDAISYYVYRMVLLSGKILEEWKQRGLIKRSSLLSLREYLFRILSKSSSGRKSAQTFTVHFPCTSEKDEEVDHKIPFILLHFDVDILVDYQDFISCILAFSLEGKFRHFDIEPAYNQNGPIIIPRVSNNVYTEHGRLLYPQEEYKGCRVERNLPLHRMRINPADVEQGRKKGKVERHLEEILDKFGSIQLYEPSSAVDALAEQFEGLTKRGRSSSDDE